MAASQRKPTPKRRKRVPSSTEETRAVWRTFASERGLNESRARDAVVETFLSTSEHVDLQTLFESSRKRHPGVSFATVYRTMKLLDDAGLAHARHFGDGKGTLYEVAVGREHHDHLICDGCGRIVEFVNDELERLQEAVAAGHGFTLSRHRHELYGLCATCRRARRR
jgi:Fur family ferric uptake transcriptional regulator